MSYLPLDIFDTLLRSHLRSAGTVVILVLCASTLVVWVLQGSESLRSLPSLAAKTFAFLAISFLSFNFLTSARFSSLENLFGGLDRQYKVHKMMGKLTLIFVVLHLAFLTINTIPSWFSVLSLYLPGLSLPNTLGIVSLFFLFVLLALTLQARISYSAWLTSHRLMIFPLLFAVVHAMIGGSDIGRYPILRDWVLLVGIVGIMAYLYTLVLYRYLGPKTRMKVVRVNRHRDLTEVHLEAESKDLVFHPGQFVFVRFPRFNNAWEMWPFSISNHPNEKTVRLSIKRLGDFTEGKVPSLKEGDAAVLMGPYGKYGERYLDHKRDMVWIAGGIGITPFLSMARNEAEKPIGREVDLIWAYRDPEEAVYHNELTAEANKSRGLKYHPWLSSEKGRLTAEKVEDLIGGRERLLGRVIFLCGPLPMMEDLSRGLIKMGVRVRNIVFEDFKLL